ncbi:MAG: repressor LexA [Cellvibrionaceae bacterium]|jgi:repressor LexA
MLKLTARQAQVLQLIKDHMENTGYPPTRADIAKELGFRSANAAEEHLRALARKGYIEMIPNASRGIRLSETENPGIPIIGRVAAGSPILAQEHIEDYCSIKSEFFSPEADYLLRVHGDSMIDAGIFDGDLLAVHRTDQASNGEIIVARIGEEVTVKRLQHQKGSSVVKLIAENADYAPIEIDLSHQDFTIEGLSVGIIRRQ